MAYGNYKATAMQDGVSNDLSRKRKELAEYNANYNPTPAQEAVNRDWERQQAEEKWAAEQEAKKRQEAEEDRLAQQRKAAAKNRIAEQRAADQAAAQQDAQNNAWKNIIDYSEPSALTSNGQTITNMNTGKTYSTPNYAQQAAEKQAQRQAEEQAQREEQARQEQMKRERELAMEQLRQQELARQAELERQRQEQLAARNRAAVQQAEEEASQVTPSTTAETTSVEYPPYGNRQNALEDVVEQPDTQSYKDALMRRSESMDNAIERSNSTGMSPEQADIINQYFSPVSPRVYDPKEIIQNLKDAGIPVDQATNMNDLYNLWQTYLANQAAVEAEDNAWGNVVEDESALAPNVTPVTPQRANESGPVYPATGTSAQIRDALVPLWAQMDIETLPILTEGLTNISDNGLEFFNSLPEAIRNQIAPGFLQWAPEKQNEFLHNLDNVVDDLYGKYDSIGREKPQGNEGPSTRYNPNFAQQFDADSSAIDWITSQPEFVTAGTPTEKAQVFAQLLDQYNNGLESGNITPSTALQDAVDWTTSQDAKDIADAMSQNYVPESGWWKSTNQKEVENNYRDGTPQEQRYDARQGKQENGNNLTPEQQQRYDNVVETLVNMGMDEESAQAEAMNQLGITPEYVPETAEQKRERLERETEAMLNGNNESGGSSVKDFINQAGDWLLENLIGSSLADSPEADIIDKAGNDFLRRLAGDSLADLVSGEEPTSESKKDRLERMNDYLRENGYTPEAYNNYGSSGGGIMDLIDGILGGGSSTAGGDSNTPTSSTTPSTTSNGTRDWEKNPPKSRDEVVQLYLEQTGKNPNDITSEDMFEINALWNNMYTPQASGNGTSGSTGSSSGTNVGKGKPPKGYETYQPSYKQGGQVVKAPYKVGGYTDSELEAMGNRPYENYRGTKSYEGYYQAPDGAWYPVDQQKAEYYQQFHTYDGWEEPMREYFDTFGTFSGYTPTWKKTGKNYSYLGGYNPNGGGNYSYSGGGSGGSGGSGSRSNGRSSGYSYTSNGGYTGNYNSNVQPELTNQTRMRINNIMRNWTF